MNKENLVERIKINGKTFLVESSEDKVERKDFNFFPDRNVFVENAKKTMENIYENDKK